MRILRTIRTPDTAVQIYGEEFHIRLSIHTDRSKRLRRQILLSIFRHLRPHFRLLRASLLRHGDSTILDSAKELMRPVSTHQAMRLRDPRGREGFALRMRRLNFRQTQAAFARLAEVSRSQLSRIEHGHHPMSPLFRVKVELAFRILENKRRRKRTNAHAKLPELGEHRVVDDDCSWPEAR